MKIYLAGILDLVKDLEIKELGVKRILSSWLEGRPDRYNGFEIFVDSGAFSAWKTGRIIKLEEYISYLKENIEHITAYANLDVVGDADATYKNQLEMESNGLNPIPTFHLREDFKWLDIYLEKYNYIALGGTVKVGKTIVEPFLDTCFSKIKKVWPKKIHGFGIASPWALQKYPFYSVDTTSWAAGRYGWIYTKTNLLHKVLSKTQQYNETFNSKERDIKNIKRFLQIEKDMVYYWQKRGIVWES